MDGVLSPTEPISCHALRLVVKEVVGVDIGSNYEKIIGLSLHDAIIFLAKEKGFNYENIDLDQLAERKNKIYFDLATGNLSPTDGLLDFLDFLEKENIEFVIASSGSLEKIQFTLKELGLVNRFENRYFSSSQVQKGKPFPDLFKFAARKMGWQDERVMVIEDSPLGIQAAIAAHMIPIGLASSFSPNELQKKGAIQVISSFFDLLP